MLAGREPSQKFHEKREALIERKYNVDEIQRRILNGDGGSWIKEPYDPDVIFQLDRYHIYQEILRKQSDKRAQKEARKPESCINTSTIIKRERAAKNHIIRLDSKEQLRSAYPMIVQQTHKSSNPVSARRTMELIDRLMETVPIYRLSCNMEPEATKVVYEGMQRYIVNDNEYNELLNDTINDIIK